MTSERTATPPPGWGALATAAGLLIFAIVCFISAGASGPGVLAGFLVITGIASFLGCGLMLAGLTVVNPNDSKVMVFFGNYVGTIRQPGFFWVNPFTIRRRVSLRVRSFETGADAGSEVRNAQGQVLSRTPGGRHPLKVNDRDGNPVEIAAVVVWQVADTAKAIFDVDDYVQFVHIQSESALRTLASQYHYDSPDDATHSLRASTDQVGERLKAELHERLLKAGVEVVEARISHLAYAPEIAAAMLQRQQATAIIAARQKIVDNAVGMVEMALERLEHKGTVRLDEARKAAIVSNLLVVLCSERGAAPIVNATSA